jgi:hypothetical protein
LEVIMVRLVWLVLGCSCSGSGGPNGDDSAAGSGDDSGSGTPSLNYGSCPQYLECLDQVGLPTATAIATWGEDGVCWSDDAAANELCRAQCSDGLAATMSKTPAPACVLDPPQCTSTLDPGLQQYVQWAESGNDVFNWYAFMGEAKPLEQIALSVASASDVHDLSGDVRTNDEMSLWYGDSCQTWYDLDTCETQWRAFAGTVSMVDASSILDSASGTVTDLWFLEWNDDAFEYVSGGSILCFDTVVIDDD